MTERVPSDRPLTPSLAPRMAARLVELMALVPEALRTDDDREMLAEAERMAAEPDGARAWPLTGINDRAVAEIARTSKDPVAVHQIMRESSDPDVSRLAVARYARVFNSALLDDICSVPAGVIAAAFNEGLTAAQCVRVLDALMPQLTDMGNPKTDSQWDLQKAVISLAARQGIPENHPVHDLLVGMSPPLTLVRPRSATFIPGEQRSALLMLSLLPSTPPERLLQYVRLSEMKAEDMTRFLHRPGLTPEIMVACLEHKTNLPAIQHVFTHDQWLQYSGVMSATRGALSTLPKDAKTVPIVAAIKRYCATGRSDQRTQARVRLFVKFFPTAAAQWIGDQPKRFLRQIDADIITPLLYADRDATRERAVQLVGLVGTEMAVPKRAVK